MGKISREGALRMDQRIGEPPDIFVMRAFAKALPHMDQDAALAAIGWMHAKAWDPKTWRPNSSSNDASDKP